MMKVREKVGWRGKVGLLGGNDGREWDAVLETLIDIAGTQVHRLKWWA
jgi:hypothetical protein